MAADNNHLTPIEWVFIAGVIILTLIIMAYIFIPTPATV